jgi:tyrosinase
MRCRKNQATLTAQEKARFVAAVLALKANGTYDQYVALHVNNMPAAHRGPAFFPWHREMLRRFELDLQAIDSSVTLPYWNWTIDNSATSSIWNADFMGGNGRPSDGKVMDGPFAFDGGNWPLAGGGFLARRFSLGVATLPTAMDLSNALEITPYDVSPYNDGSSLAGFRNTLEGWRNGPQLHNRVHVWVGGSMSPSSSPNDPVFFLHHCFIDKCWADWQALHPTEAAYAPTSGAASGHNLNDAMQPWAGLGQTITPASLVDHHALGYAYDTEGVCKPTLKFIDDGGGIKQLVDTHITLKLLDDHPTLKLIDDTGTLKFADDGGGTFKSADDVKLPAFDIGNPVKFAEDQMTPFGVGGDPRGGAPFVLATPHHSMAWANTFPGALEGALAQLTMQLASLEGMAAEFERREKRGELTDAERSQRDALRREIVGIRDEREALERHLRK